MKRLLERDDLLAAAGRLLDQAAGGSAGVLFVVAEAGLGKSSILAGACALARQRSVAVGLGRGEAMEMALPFGLIAQVLDGLGGADVLGEPSDAPGPDLRAARFYGVRRWLQNSGPGPLLLALDDVHWADPDSLALLSFLCRRIAALPVAVIATLRPWPTPAFQVAEALSQAGFATITRLDPLTRGGTAALLADRTGRAFSAPEVDRATEICAGNPLLLEQVAAAIAHGDDVPAPVAGQHPQLHGQLLLARFAGLSAPGLNYARAAAVFGTRFRPDLAAELAGLGGREGDEAIDALERGGLTRSGRGGAAEFVHPLFRQALYDDLGGAIRARYHARAFALLVQRGLADEAVEHAISADLTGDPAAIDVLAAAGRTARDRGATETAVGILESAVALAGDRASAELLADLAEVLAAGGRPAEAASTCERVLGLPDVPVMVRARVLQTMARALVYQGSFEAGRRRLDECVEVARDQDPAFAVEALLSYSQVAWLVDGPAASTVVNSRAVDLARQCDDEMRRRAAASWTSSALLTGDPSGVEDCADFARAADAEAADSFRAARDPYPTVAKYVERLAESERFYRARLRAAERFGLAELEASALVSFADTLTRMLLLDEAAEMIERGARLSDLVPLAGPLAEVCRHNLALFAGRLDECDELARRAEANIVTLAIWPASLWLDYGRGWRCLADGRFFAACEIYARIEALVARVGIGEPCTVPWAGHAITAYVQAARIADAERLLGWLDRGAARLPCRWPRIAAASGRALIAEAAGDRLRADELYQHAMHLHGEVDLPLERLQTTLEYGRFLRRSGQLQRCRPLLARAAEVSERVGAEWLAGQARQELRVAGGRRRRTQTDPRQLTAQEVRVATLAADGATNAEIASALFVTVSTVETHLEHIFAKLAIRSRRQLRAALAGTETATSAAVRP